MDNLYSVIQDVQMKHKEALAKYLELRSKMSHYNYEPDEEMYEKYSNILKRIEKAYKLDYKKLARIISKANGKEYRFMVFREVDLTRGGWSAYITCDYIACFVNKNFRYFSMAYKEGEGILLYKDNYNELLSELNDANSVIVARGDNINSREFNPCKRLEDINYIQLYTSDIPLVRPEFKEQVKPIIQTVLEKVEVKKEKKDTLGI